MSRQNKPELRFQGFSEEWEQKKLFTVAEFSKGRGYSKNDLISNGTPIILYGRMYTMYQTEITYLDTYVVDNGSSVYSIGNEVIVPASGETANDIARASAVKNSGIIIGGDLNIIYPKFIIDSTFLALTITHGKQKRNLSKLAQGKSVVHLHNSELREISLQYPTIDEQKKIGTFFKTLDKLIALKQNKYDKLVNIKKACLRKMFPQAGADKPELRFKGFSEKWEQKKLGEVINICSGCDYKHLSVGSIPVYGTGGYILSVNKALSYTKDAIGIGRKGTIDKPYALKAPFWTVDTLFYAIPIQNNILDYLLYIIQEIDWKKKDESTGVPSLSRITIISTDIFVTKYAEQKKIGNFFRTLDKLIDLRKKELTKLKNLKKSCLAKMFI